MAFIDGLASGLDTTSIVNQLMQIERRPQVALTTRRDQEEAARKELSGIRSDVNALRSLAADLRLTSGWDRLKVTSSNPDAVSVTATSGAATGSYSFQVTSLATAASVYSTDTYASLDTVIADPGASVFQASGYSSLGFSSLSGSGFSVGDITFEVTRSSAAAEVEAPNIPTIPITVDGTNDNIQFEVDGFSFSVTLSHGIYEDAEALAGALSAAIDANPQARDMARASVNPDGKLVLSTVAEGSAHSLSITGGSALASLGFYHGGSGKPGPWASADGVDGIVEVNGVATSIPDATSGATITLPGGGGASIDAVLSGPIRVGSATAAQVTPGTGTLSELVSTINASDLGYTAAAVDTGNGYRLQLTANETGAASAFTPDAGLLGNISFNTLSVGTDAELTIQGDQPFTITSSTNTFDQLLPGVSVTVNAVTDSPVTVSTERDVEAVSGSVGELVTKMNEILTRIAEATANQPNSARSVLQGHREARSVADQLRNALVAPLEGNALSSVGVVGIELTRDGKLEFDAAEFSQALQSDPEALTALFADRSSGTAPGAEPGVLDRLVGAAEAAASVGSGTLYTATQAAERRIEDYGRQIDAYERRLELREASLRRTYANLEVALGGLQQQSSYLASQLASLGGGLTT
jgi:flagellar hook-associated protein 2